MMLPKFIKCFLNDRLTRIVKLEFWV